MTNVIFDKITLHLREGDDESVSYNDITDKPTLNGVMLDGDLTSHDVGLPRIFVVQDFAELNDASINLMECGDIVLKQTGNERHSYVLAYLDRTGGECSFVYTDHENVEEVYFEKVNNVWTYIQTDITPISNSVQLSVSTTYAELKALRDGGHLVPGTWYRITDYECLIDSNRGEQCAGHRFDIIVLADDPSHLNETAYAAHHEGDTYFQYSNLDAWELKYALDNDRQRFLWADETNGKGVVYYMKDEWGNECCYDFKNILYLVPTSGGVYDPTGPSTLVYTFNYDDGEPHDATVDTGNGVNCSGNVIKMALGMDFFTGTIAQDLNYVALLTPTGTGVSCDNNSFGKGCSFVFLNTLSSDNKFGDYCNGIFFTSAIKKCTFGNYCGYIRNTAILNRCCFSDNVTYLKITNAGTGTYVQNIQVLSGKYGTDDNQNIGIAGFQPDKDYTQIAALDTNGTIKVWNPADLVP